MKAEPVAKSSSNRQIRQEQLTGNIDYKSVGAVANAISILRSLAQHIRPVGVAAVARETGISISTCFNILRTLAQERIISFDSEMKTYAIGMGVLEFSLPILGSNQADLLRPELERLSDTHKTIVCLWQVVKDDRIVLIDKFSAPRIVRVDIPDGARLPAFAGAIGRCYAAHLHPSETALRSVFKRIKWQSAISFEQYRSEVEAARQQGFAFDSGELFAGLDIAASLIIDGSGNARFGISGIAIAETKSKQEMLALAADLRDTAKSIAGILFKKPEVFSTDVAPENAAPEPKKRKTRSKAS